MSETKNKETFYFSHDYNSREDEKIRDLIFQCGMTGYGIYWAIVEMLYQNANALRTHYARIAHDLHQSNQTIVKEVIEDFDLFQFSEDGEYFFSNSIKRRLEKREEKSRKARESAQSRWNKSEKNANALREKSERNAIKESKGKENKGNNILLKKESKDLVPPPQTTNELFQNEETIKLDPEEKEKSSAKKEKEVVEYFHEKCKRLPKVLIINQNRKKSIKARIHDFGIEKIKEVFQMVANSNFLNGENPRQWAADFDWIMKPTNFTKILEGNYVNKVYNSTDNKNGNSQTAKRR